MSRIEVANELTRGKADEKRFRAGELYHHLKVEDGKHFVVRVDGRSFSSYVREPYRRPYDERFSEHMLRAAEEVVLRMGAVAAHTHSDEISAIFEDTYAGFDREVEKLVSLCAATAAAAFTYSSGDIVAFDGRVALVGEISGVAEYLEWRQRDAWRACVNSWAYWTARSEGLSGRAAERQTSGSQQEKREYLAVRGIDVTRVPAWQRRGSFLGYQVVPHVGVDPRTGAEVETTRRRLVVDRDLVHGEAFASYVREYLETVASTRA